MSSLVKKQTNSIARDASVASINYSSNGYAAQSRYRNRLQIEALLQRFNEANSHVDLNADQTNFNLINYEHEDQKIKYDPQMMAAKLRKLENRAQINRAQREIQNRQKKKSKRLTFQKPKQITQNYKTIYKNFLQNNKLNNDFQDFSDDQSTQNKSKPTGVAYFTQLKRHPMLLEYTIKKINNKEKVDEQKLKKLENTLTRFKKNNNQVPKQYKDIVDDFNKKLNQLSQNNPESIIQTRFSKFYSKKSSDKLSRQIVKNPRCSKMIEKQNEIVSEMDEKSLSKQNKQKLKSRLNQIITSISKSEKMNSFVLPKLNSAHKQHNDK